MSGNSGIIKTKDYFNSVHLYGKIWMLSALTLFIAVPAFLSIYYSAWPRFNEFFMGFIGIAPTFWVVAIIEMFTYIPMLGVGGSYLGFVTGNLSNLKVPCAINAMSAAKVEAGTKEGEIVSTIAIAVSSIVTTCIITIGVFMLFWIRPILEAPVLAPAFANILPAMFGALGVVMISRGWKIAVAPIVFMLVLFMFIPGLASSVGILVPAGVVIAVFSARLLYKKGWL
ncbi:MAG: hypothetical protein LBD23_18445 [Oscillospiraceae bacterium]|jgi:hypothetical protein|nr:hypothetical protein [Oscillospiraceae bacterium]